MSSENYEPDWEAITRALPAFVYHLKNTPSIAIPSDTERGIPPATARQVVRKFHGRTASVILSRCDGVYYVTLRSLISGTPDNTFRLEPREKANAIIGARFLLRLADGVGRYAVADAAAARVAASFSKS